MKALHYDAETVDVVEAEEDRHGDRDLDNGRDQLLDETSEAEKCLAFQESLII